MNTTDRSQQAQPAPARRGSTPPSRRGARWAALGLVPLLGVITACQAPRPDVTFYGNGNSVDTAPTAWCPLDTENLRIGQCEETGEADLPRLELQPGQPVQINVPTAIAEQPWQIYFRYLTPDGQLADGRTTVFSDHRLAYTLRPLDAGDQLTVVRVLAGFVPTAADEFDSTQAWELRIEPEQPSGQTSPDFDTENTEGTA